MQTKLTRCPKVPLDNDGDFDMDNTPSNDPFFFTLCIQQTFKVKVT